MPRLDDGQLATSSNKFKKRRAWLLTDEEPILEDKKSTADSSIILPTLPIQMDVEKEVTSREHNKNETRLEHDNNKAETRLQHDHNKTTTKPQHDHNKTATGLEHEVSSHYATLSEHDYRPQQDHNKSETRSQQDYNKTTTRLEHESNKTATRPMHSFFEFILRYKEELAVFDDDYRCLVLGLSDVQKRMFWHVAINCICRGSQRTGPIEIKGFFSVLGISIGVVRMSLDRLVQKGLLQKEKGKLGKNGFAIISLPRAIHDVAKELFTNFNSTQAS